MILLALAMLLGDPAATADQRVGAGPEPSPTPVSWELDFEFEHPQRIEVQTRGHRQSTVYWYVVYRVTNPSARTQDFFPIFQLVTDKLQVIKTDMGISPVVFNAIRERHALTHPYLLPPSKVIGELKTGEDYTRESVAIWRANALDAQRFTIFVAGLSGETRFLRNPAHSGDDTNRGDESAEAHFTLRKTLELSYALPGSEHARGAVRPVFLSRRWIMR